MEPHSSVDATITDRHGNSETVYAGSLPTWAAKDPEAFGPWKKVRRTMLLEDRTSDPQGWRVKFTVTHEEPDEEEAPRVAPPLDDSTRARIADAEPSATYAARPDAQTRLT